VIRAKSEICTQVDHNVRRIRHVLEMRLRNYRHELRHLASSDRLGLLRRRITTQRERLNRRRISLHRLVESRTRELRTRLRAVEDPLARVLVRVQRARHQLESTLTTLNAVSPLSVLSRGYAIAFFRTRNRRKPILDSAAVQVGDPIEVQLKKGRLECTVDAKTMGLETVWPNGVTRETERVREGVPGPREDRSAPGK
jgi:exonuclease VII large subunit